MVTDRFRSWAGLVVAATGAPVVALAVDAVTLMVAAVMIVAIRQPTQARRARRSAQGVSADIIEGFRCVWAHRLVRALALAPSLPAAFASMA